jgi:hypothetical protein
MGLNREQTLSETIIISIRNGWGILLVVSHIMGGNLCGKIPMFQPSLKRGQIFNRHCTRRGYLVRI